MSSDDVINARVPFAIVSTTKFGSLCFKTFRCLKWVANWLSTRKSALQNPIRVLGDRARQNPLTESPHPGNLQSAIHNAYRKQIHGLQILCQQRKTITYLKVNVPQCQFTIVWSSWIWNRRCSSDLLIELRLENHELYVYIDS